MGQGAWGTGREKKRALLGVMAIVTCLLCLFTPTVIATVSPGRVNETTLTQTGDRVEQGKALYAAGQFEQAAILLEQAARSQPDPLRRAAILANLSLAYQQLGAVAKATTAIDESQSLIKTLPLSDRSTQQTRAQILDVQGRLLLMQGSGEQALATSQQAETLYQQADDAAGVVKSRLNQAQALRSLGFNRRALEQLNSLNQTLQAQPDSRQKAIAFRALGDALQLSGDLKQATHALTQSLAIAQRLQLPAETAATLLSLGNAARAQSNGQDPAIAQTQVRAAINYYQQVVSLSPPPLVRIQAQLNHLNLLIDQNQWAEVSPLLAQIPAELNQLPASRPSIYARINFARTLLRLSDPEEVKTAPVALLPDANRRSQLLQTTLESAIRQARQLNDQRAESYALGTLGAVYEQTGQIQAAKETTRNALVLAQASNTWDIAYRWQWQLGRLLRRDGSVIEAIGAYDAAIANLKSLRSDLASVNPDVQFNFRDGVEPIYRQSVELLLQAEQQEADSKKAAAWLEAARERIEALQLAELDNFFREACLEGKRISVDEVVDTNNPNTTIIYPIVLRNQNTVSLQVIAKIPNQPLKRYPVPSMPEAEFDQAVSDLRTSLATALNAADLATLRSRAQRVYNWLIAPIDRDIQALEATKPKAITAKDSKSTKVDTLVFVLDDALRNIPMAMLWDGQQYLVEKYGIALSVGLQLFDPKPITREPMRVLAAGLGDSPKNSPRQFDPLLNVQAEIESISSLGVATTPLLNQNFTSITLETNINAAPFNVVHLATHGEFSSRADGTYILAADGPIYVSQFDTLLRSRDVTRAEAIQLLVLSACQTAKNDNRATLGLAGFAVRAGARSTLASLISVQDDSTPLLIQEFYKALNSSTETLTKAEALRRAQISLIKSKERNYQRPLNWAPFVLIGNWL